MYEQHIEELHAMLWSKTPEPTPRQSTALSAAMALMRKGDGAHREDLERARAQGRTEGYEAAADAVNDANAHAEAFKVDAERLESALREVAEAAAIMLAKHLNHPPASRAPLEVALEKARLLITPPDLSFQRAPDGEAQP